MMHNFASVYVSMSAAMYACGADDRFPAKDTDATIFLWFYSLDCSHQATEMSAMSLFFTLTFFVVDASVMLWRAN